MIDLTVDEAKLERAVKKARERNVVIPTFRQMKDPERHTPQKIKDRLKNVGLWDVDSANLFRITWKNEPVKTGGLYGGVNFLELPRAITGVDARIVALVGKWFPTGAHKVGASFGCLVPRLVTGQFDPSSHRAVWPSTGNYCRGGVAISRIMHCHGVAILPEGMSEERFRWLDAWVRDPAFRRVVTEASTRVITGGRRRRDLIPSPPPWTSPGSATWPSSRSWGRASRSWGGARSGCGASPSKCPLP